MEWVQNYDPVGSAFWSTAVAAVPIVLLLGLLLIGWPAPRAAATGLFAALAVSIAFFGMPADAAIAAAGYGALFGLMPIGWLVFNAVFLFQLTVRSGQFDVVKRSVAMLSPDRRMQALLIAFSFGAFLEGCAGFGTPVAITAALLIGIGFSPLYAACLSLIANTAPVAFGSLGIPITTLANVSGLDEMQLSQTAGRQLPLFSLIIPAWLVAVMSGWRGLRGAWPAILVCGGTFGTIQFLVSNFLGPNLVDVLGGLGSMLALVVFLQFWKPKDTWRFADEPESQPTETAPSEPRPTGHQIAYAWGPWIMLSLMIFAWGVLRVPLDGGTSDEPNALNGISVVAFKVPALNEVVFRAPPVARAAAGESRAATPEKAVYEFKWLSASGTCVLLAAVAAAIWLRIGPRDFFHDYMATLYRARWALATIACMLALAYTTKYSGADATLGLAFTHTGWLYPFFAPLLGWLGVALTGSDTSANALFGSLQRITAQQLGLNETLIVASNSTGGVMGKMIDAQSIVVAAVATHQTGEEGRILRFVFPHSLALAALIGLLTFAQAYWLTAMVPGN